MASEKVTKFFLEGLKHKRLYLTERAKNNKVCLPNIPSFSSCLPHIHRTMGGNMDELLIFPEGSET